tara:strand:+ start:2463 stop:2591 length:129 start_codon:yes stop_codon:yes gene_type:complete
MRHNWLRNLAGFQDSREIIENSLQAVQILTEVLMVECSGQRG